MLLLALVRGRTALCSSSRLLPEAPSIWTCVSGCLSSCPFQTGRCGVAVRTLLQYPVPWALGVQLSLAGGTNPQWGCGGDRNPRSLGTPSLCDKQGQLGISAGDCGCRSAGTTPSACFMPSIEGLVTWQLLITTPFGWKPEQWRRDESFCIPKAIP